MARPLRLPTTARGERIYAIGDVHGRLDLFVRLVALIRQDAETRPRPRRTRILLIGDLIDPDPRPNWSSGCGRCRPAAWTSSCSRAITS
jgi:hypothetical protein